MQKQKPDSSIFYSLACVNAQREKALQQAEWGQFISPCSSTYVVQSNSLDFSPFLNLNPQFDSLIKVYTDKESVPSRCSAQYYADCFGILMQTPAQRMVEVGVGKGDLSCLFALLAHERQAGLDLVDVDKDNLLASFAAIQHFFPQAASSVRLFLGDLPLYIKNVAALSTEQHFIHYKGSINFNDVVRDIGATFYIKDKVTASMVHNTHVRTNDMNHYAFVDIALYALFGAKMQFLKLGEQANRSSDLDQSQTPAQYFPAVKIEGVYIPYQQNYFRYPHPQTSLESFLYQALLT